MVVVATHDENRDNIVRYNIDDGELQHILH